MKEIRDKAWRLLWISKWLNRFVFLLVAFGFIRYLAINFAMSLLGSSMNVLNERLMAVETFEGMLTIMCEPANMRSIILMMALALFVATIINGIASYGLSRLRLGVAGGNQPENWQRMSFSGFRDPFNLFLLEFLHGIFVCWPFLLSIATVGATWAMSGSTRHTLPYMALALPILAIISIVNFYRYRQAWFLKATHNDWPALKCLRESARMMAGNKRRCFTLDCAFWRPVTLMLSSVLVASILTIVGAPSFLVFLSTLLTTALNLYLGAYIPLGQAALHLELAKTGESGK